MTREFNVPVNQLFEAFKSPEAMKAWWWPNTLYADRVDIDFREGGKYFVNMKGYDKGGGGATGKFEEIIPNKRIVMTDYFADENGNAISAKDAKMPGTWPEVVYITFDFESAGENKSRLLFAQEGIPAEVQKDCIQGWSEMLDKLENYLSGQKQ
jgi:uncharacterized protein YndB with AHSA1/START domain